MKKNNKKISLAKSAYLVFSISVLCFALVSVSFAAWQNPTAAPPGNNAPAPLNVSSAGQYKLGTLSIGGNGTLGTTLDIEGTIGSTGGAILNTGGAVNALLIPLGKVGIGTATPNNLLQVADLINFFDDAKTSLAIGYQALHSNTTGSENTANGYQALFSNTTGWENTANGKNALFSNTTGHQNIADGQSALYYNTTGSNNTADGFFSLSANTAGNGNTASGYYSLQSNTTGSNNTAIGNNADVLSSNLTNATAIGYYAKVGGSNMLVLGGTGGFAVNVGIGTATPSAKLEIYTGNGTSGIKTSLICNGTTSNNKLWTDASGNIICGADASGSGTGNLIDTLSDTLGAGDNAEGHNAVNFGNVGIGTATPATKLEIVGGLTKTTGGLIIETRNGSDPSSPATGQLWLRTDINP
ncbi:MAG: hypothetical protein NTY81_03140 [Candidatus Staskawiczbacteria bacterium]|nr:hypothetical protein [Candidatus Staskawiczbacteria bacterium]